MIDRFKWRPGDFVGSDKLFIFPPIENNYSGSGLSGVTTVSHIIDEYQVLTDEFRSIAVFNTENNASEGYQETYFYVTNHVVIVRKDLIEYNEICNLIEYEVIH